jgi:phage baseplate assembly protein W
MRAIQYPFRLDRNKNVAECTSYDDVVRGQVIDALMTNQGERVFRPRYGCDVQAALFDPTDELVRRDAAAFLKTKLENTVTRAIIRSVTLDTRQGFVSPTPMYISDPSAVIITVVYRASLYATDTTLNIPVASEFVRRQLEGGVFE